MSKCLLAFRHETRNFPFKWPGLSVPKWLLPRFGWPRILWEGQSRRNRIFGSIANYWNIGQDQLNFLLPRESLKGGESISGIVVVSHPLPLPSLNSPLERYPFPRWLSTVCNKREIGEAEWRKRGEGKEGRGAFGKQSYPTRPPPSPRFSSQGRDVCTWANSRCTVPFPRDINFSGSNLRHFSLPPTSSPLATTKTILLSLSLSLFLCLSSSNERNLRGVSFKKKERGVTSLLSDEIVVTSLRIVCLYLDRVSLRWR